MMTEDCTDILTAGDDRTKILNIASNSYSNIVYFSGHKNPFDRQFELALKNGITYPNLSSSSSNNSNTFNPSSPLNTPLIPPDSAFNNNNTSSALLPDLPTSDPSPAITTAQITNLILDCEINKETELNEKQQTTNNNVVAVDSDTTITNLTTIDNENKNNKIEQTNANDIIRDNVSKIKHRSNVVSVICPPVQMFRDEKILSAPVILESANNNEMRISNNNDNNTKKLSNQPNIINASIGVDKPKGLESTTIGTLVPEPSPITNSDPLIKNKHPPIPPAPQQQQQTIPTNFNYQLPESSSSPLKKILPKQNCTIDSSISINNNNSNSSCGDIAQRLSSLPPTRRKEKTLDELINKIKATEAALPPKAKPGRKSKTAREEDSKERKRLSLERNRAAAMRCRLKKKKEIDELKRRVEDYEQQNQHLKKIIDSLKTEVTYLKNELMRHKDCN